MTYKAMKFRVKSADHSIDIQQALFKEGYGWGDNLYKETRHRYSAFLYAHKDGHLTHDSTEDEQFFVDHPNEEYLLVDGKFVLVKEHEATKPLLSRSEHQTIRFKDVVDAIYRYGINGKHIPEEWIEELQDLNRSLKQ